MSLFRAPLLVLLLWMPAAPAAAQTCSFSITALNFGSVNVLTGGDVDFTATLTGSCSGFLLSSNVRVCPNIGSGTGGTDASGVRQMLSGVNILKHQLYSNSARTSVWGSYLWAFATRPPTLDVPLNVTGSGDLPATTLYGRVFANQTVAPPGSYVSSFGGGHVTIRYRSGSDACTASASGWSTASPGFNVTATIPANCLVSASNVNFGAKGVLDTAVDATADVTVACTMGNAYSVALNGGLSSAPPASRLMTKGAEAIVYSLYKDAARTQVWGDASVPDGTVSGTGDGQANAIPVYGRVPAQMTPSPGTYSDTVVVTVTY